MKSGAIAIKPRAKKIIFNISYFLQRYELFFYRHAYLELFLLNLQKNEFYGTR